jgi:hypothetical protein
MGTFTADEGAAFYDVRDPRHTIAIDLENEPLRQIVVEVGNETPDRAASRILSARDAVAAGQLM